MSGSDEFEWVSKEDLMSSTEEELIEQIMNLQQQLYAQREKLDDLQELAYLSLDLHAGIAEDMHPDLFDAVESTTSEQAANEDTNGNSETQ